MWSRSLTSGGRLLSDLIGFDGESFDVLGRWTHKDVEPLRLCDVYQTSVVISLQKSFSEQARKIYETFSHNVMSAILVFLKQ